MLAGSRAVTAAPEPTERRVQSDVELVRTPPGEGYDTTKADIVAPETMVTDGVAQLHHSGTQSETTASDSIFVPARVISPQLDETAAAATTTTTTDGSPLHLFRQLFSNSVVCRITISQLLTCAACAPASHGFAHSPLTR